jgi:hypothetical protein
MGNSFPARIRVEPSYVDPGIIVQYNQASGAFECLPSGAPTIRLSDVDQYVYMRTLQVRALSAAGQGTTYNSLPSCSIVANEISTPTYRQRVRAEYDHHDTAAANRYGIALPQAQSLAMRAGMFQQSRNALLYGYNPQNGEGLLNTNGATATNLPPDSFANTTFVTYDNGDMAFFILEVVEELKARTYQLGMPVSVTILGPQRILGPMGYQNIVQLTQYQRIGAGSLSTRATIDAQLKENADSLIWTYDDTLIGKGANGADAVLIIVRDLSKPSVPGINTNVFADVTPSTDETVRMYADMAAPREIPTPLPGGAIDVLAEWMTTSGWMFRPEAETIVSIPYS